MLNKNFHLKFLPQHVVVIFLALIFTPLIYSRSLANGTELPRHAFITALTLFSIILFLSRFIRKPVFYFNNLYFLLLIFFIWSVISLTWSLDPGKSLIELSHLFSCVLILFLAMQTRHTHHYYFIINGAIFTCLLVSIIGLSQNMGFNPLYIHFFGTPASTFINPNHASIYIEFFIPVLFILILYEKNTAYKTYYSITLILALVFLYILSSFGTLISLMLTFSIIIFLLFKKTNFSSILQNNRAHLALIIICSTILIYTSFYFTKNQQAKNFIPSDPISQITTKSSHQMRLGLYLKSIESAKENPLTGFGYGGFRAGILPYIAEIQSITQHNEHLYYLEAHNDYLQQVTETGIINGAVFIIFFTLVLFSGLNSLKNTKLSDANIFIFAISSGLLALILHSFVDFPFHLSVSALLIYISSGLILSTTAKKIDFKPNFHIKTILIFMTILLFLYLIISIYFNIRYIKSSKLVRDAAIALHKEKNCDDAIKLIDESNRLFKYDFQHQASQTQIYGVCPQSLTKQQTTIAQLVKLNPTNFRARFLRGQIALLTNKEALAFDDFAYIVKMLPYSALGYTGLGDWAIKVNKINDARIYYEKALSISPNNEQIKQILLTIRAKTG